MAARNLKIRCATKDDLPLIIRLLADDEIGAIREDLRPKASTRYEAAFKAIQDDPNSELLIATLGGSVVGCLQLTVIPGLSHRGVRRCQIEDVRVMRQLRGSGVGSLLMEEAESRAIKRGCELLQLLVHSDRTDALRFYQRCGFEGAHCGFRKSLRS
jgi:ribosomal protein S18 acetylase RimI-like enzyme